MERINGGKTDGMIGENIWIYVKNYEPEETLENRGYIPKRERDRQTDRQTDTERETEREQCVDMTAAYL